MMDDHTKQVVLKKVQALVRDLQKLQALLENPKETDGLTPLQQNVFKALGGMKDTSTRSRRQVQQQLARDNRSS